MKNHIRNIEQLKMDLQMARNSHEQDVKRATHDIDLLREELEMTKGELNDGQTQNLDYRSTIMQLNDEIDKSKRLQDDSMTEVCKQSSRIFFIFQFI